MIPVHKTTARHTFFDHEGNNTPYPDEGMYGAASDMLWEDGYEDTEDGYEDAEDGYEDAEDDAYEDTEDEGIQLFSVCCILNR